MDHIFRIPRLNFSPIKLLDSGFLHNVIALYGVQACTYALPLLTFPYLAHVLGPSGWGVVVFAQAIGIVITCVVEYGFDISAARRTSLHRDDPERLSELISGVLGANRCWQYCALPALFFPAGLPTASLLPRCSSGQAPSGAFVRASTCFGFSKVWNG
jgi:Polysaccharide biosynthesis protein